MPLPPIPGADWLRFRADAWRKQQQAQLDQLQQQASAWDLEAQRAVHGIGDTFSSIGSGVQQGVQSAREAVQEVAPPPPPPLPVQDWAQQAQGAVDAIGQAVSRPDAQWNPLEGAAAAFPDDPNAGAKFAAQSVGRGINTAQNQSQQAVDAMMGFGPQGANLPAQAMGAFDVATTPYTAPGRATSAAATNLGASPEGAALAGGIAGAVGPGGTLGSIESGLAANAPSALRFAAPALGAIGAATGIGTGIAAGAPAEEVLTRGFEGANIGAGVGELGATLGPQVPGIARGVADYAGRFGEAAQRLYGAELGTLGAVRNADGAPSGRVMAKQLLAAGEEARPASRSQNGVSPDWGAPPPGGWVDPITGERVVPPAAGEPISMSEYGYWDDVKRGVNPLPGLQPGAGTPTSSTDLSQGRYRWDLQNAPPPRGPNGELPGKLDFTPLPRVDWDTLLAEKGYAPPQGTDPALLKQILTAYDDDDLKVKDVVAALGYRGPQAKAIEDDANAALNALGTPYKKTQSEWGAVKSEREAGGKFTYYSPKMGKLMFFDSSPEVVAAMRLDADPNVAEYLKGGGKRARVRFVIHPESRFDPNPPPGWEILRTQGILDAGKEGIYSPDFLVRSVPDEAGVVKEGMIEVKSLAAPNQPAYKIQEKVDAARDLFENHWGLPFHVWGEDQIGRRFMGDLAQKDPALPDELLDRIGQGIDDPAAVLRMRQDFVKKMKSGSMTARTDLGPTWLRAPLKEGAPPLTTSTEEYLDFNAASKYPPVAADPTQRMPALRATVREQVARHNQAGVDGSTFTAAGDDAVTPDLGGYMVSVAPERMQRVVGHELKDWRLAQFVLENEDYLEAFPNLHVGTFKTVEPNGTAITQLDLTMHVPDGATATEVANLYRQKRVYDVAAGANTATDAKRWLPTNLTPEARRVRLNELLAAADTGGPVPAAPGGLRGAAGDAAAVAVTRDVPPGGAGGAGGTGPGGGGVPAVGGPAGAGADRFGAVARAGPAQPYAPDRRAAAAAALAPDGRAGAAVGGPGGAGAPAAGVGSPFEEFLSQARAATQPFMARGAQTGAERAFDIGAGTAGGVLGAATADEDATWQERAGRGVLGASLGALGGANARQLARIGGEASAAGTLGVRAPGGVLGPAERDALRQATAAGREPPPEVQRQMDAAARVLAQPKPDAVKDPAGANAWEKALAFMTSNLLSNPRSLLQNALGGVEQAGGRLLGYTLEGRPGDFWTELKAAWAAKGDALSGALHQGLTGERPAAVTEALGGASDAAQHPEAFPGKAGLLATPALRVAGATDALFSMGARAGAEAVADARGLEGAQRAAFIKGQTEQAVLSKPASPLAKTISEGRQLLTAPDSSLPDRLKGAAMFAYIPVVKIPETIWRQGVRRAVSPVTDLPLAAVRAARGEGAAAGKTAANWAVNSTIGGVIAWQVGSGNMTGSGPQDDAERRRWEAQGWRPTSVRIGGDWYSYDFLGPLGLQMNLMATFSETLAAEQRVPTKSELDRYTAAFNRFGSAAYDEFYLSNFLKMAYSIGEGKLSDALTKGAEELGGRLVPYAGAQNWLAKGLDPVAREPQGPLEAVQSRTLLREGTSPRIDPTTGRPQRVGGTTLERLGGFGRITPEPTPAAREVARLQQAKQDVSIRAFSPKEKYRDVEQTPAQRRALATAYGEETGKATREVFDPKTPIGKAYAKADDAEKARLLRSRLEHAAVLADITAGATVARTPKGLADYEYAAVPHYDGVSGSADAVRRGNEAVRDAKAQLAAYRKKYPEDGEDRFERDFPKLYELSQVDPVDADDLKARRAAIDKKHKVTR